MSLVTARIPRALRHTVRVLRTCTQRTPQKPRTRRFCNTSSKSQKSVGENAQSAAPKELTFSVPPLMTAERWLRGCVVVFGFTGLYLTGTAGYDNNFRVVSEELQDYSDRPIAERVKILFEVMELSTLAPFVVHGKWMEPLLSALKDEEIVLELRLKVIRSMTKMAQFSRIRESLFENDPKVLSSLIFRWQSIASRMEVDDARNTLSSESIAKMSDLEKQEFFALSQLFKELYPGRGEQRSLLQTTADGATPSNNAHLCGLTTRKVEACLDSVPRAGQKYLRLVNRDDVFLKEHLDNKSIMSDLRMRAAVSFLIGTAWAGGRLLLRNRALLSRFPGTTLTNSFFLGSTAGVMGIAWHMADAFTDEIAFDEFGRWLAESDYMRNLRYSTLLMSAVEVANFVKIAAFGFAAVSIVPYSVVPFISSFLVFQGLRMKLDSA